MKNKYKNYDITLIQYFATGEGLYVDFRINPTKEEIEVEIPDYYHISIIGCTWNDIDNYLNNNNNNKELEKILNYLITHQPEEYKLIASGIKEMKIKVYKRLNIS